MKKSLLIILLLCFKIVYARDVAAVTNFQANHYLGVWYEIARLPNWFERKCIAPISATYSRDITNTKQLIVTNTCNTKEHELSTTTGIAYFAQSADIAKLKVTFLPKALRWLPFGRGDYWVLDVDYTKVAVVGSPDHKYLWILARSTKLNTSELNAATMIAQQQGFDTTKLIIN